MLRRRGIPLVLCTSKTRAEVAALWAELGSEHLAVIEDGAGLLVPSGLLPRVPLSTARRTAHGRLVPLTVPPVVGQGSVVGPLQRKAETPPLTPG